MALSSKRPRAILFHSQEWQKLKSRKPSSVICRPASFPRIFSISTRTAQWSWITVRSAFFRRFARMVRYSLHSQSNRSRRNAPCSILPCRKHISNSIITRLKRMRKMLICVNTSTSIMMSLWTDTATSTKSRTPSLSLWTPTAVTHSHWSVVKTGILSRLIYSTTRYPSPLTKLLLSIHLWRRYQRRLINMER